jgi:4-oxalomesaconate tautomerase
VKALPCDLMRGGTSKAAYFLASDLPPAGEHRDAVLLSAMGSPDARQIDGIGGGTSLTTKVAIVSPSLLPDSDVDYLFAQIVIGERRVDYAPTCGNILAGVGPFAIEHGLVPAMEGETAVRIRMANTNSLCVARVKTPARKVTYSGDTAISGVPGKAAPIELFFSNTLGSTCGSLFPTGSQLDVVDGIAVTCVDNGMPVVLIEASQLGITGNEAPQSLDTDEDLKRRIENIRLIAGERMGLGDVSNKVIPKITLTSPPSDGGALNTRTFIPRKCHEAIGVLGAISVASACVYKDSVVHRYLRHPVRPIENISLEHATGEFTVRLFINVATREITGAAILRTARLLMRGTVFLPEPESQSMEEN